MDMPMQQLLFVTALFAFAAGAVLTGITVRYYVANDIHGVRNDLGRHARQRKASHVREMSHMRVRGTSELDMPDALPGDVDMDAARYATDEHDTSAAMGSGSFRITKDICLCEAKEGVW